jgi:hypothetical protein
MSLIATTRAQIGAFVVAAGFAGAAIAAQPSAFASADPVAVSTGAAPTIVALQSSSDDSASLSGVIGRLRSRGYKVASAPIALSGDAADSVGVENFLQTIPGSIVLVAAVPHDAAVDKVAADDAQVKAVVYVSAYESGSQWRTGELSCSSGTSGFSGISGLPFLSPMGGGSAPVCTSPREAYDSATTASIVKVAQSVEHATLNAGMPMR